MTNFSTVSELKSTTTARNLKSKVLVNSSTSKTAKNGNPFVDLELSDKTGTIAAKIWDCAGGPKPGTVIIIEQCTINVWQGQSQVVIYDWKADESANISDYTKSSFRPPEWLFDELLGLLIDHCEHDVYVLVHDILATNRTKLLACPAAAGNHHARHGGLLEHTHSMAHLAISVHNHYANRYVGKYVVDLGLLLAGVVLHDLGKIHELSGPIGTEYTDTGKLVGHIPYGLLMLEEEAKHSSIDPETLDRLRHMILSHHGKLEWGSPVEPCTPEAIILHHLDMLDSRFDALATAVNEAGRDATWTEKSFALGNKAIYIGTPAHIQTDHDEVF